MIPIIEYLILFNNQKIRSKWISSKPHLLVTWLSSRHNLFSLAGTEFTMREIKSNNFIVSGLKSARSGFGGFAAVKKWIGPNVALGNNYWLVLNDHSLQKIALNFKIVKTILQIWKNRGHFEPKMQSQVEVSSSLSAQHTSDQSGPFCRNMSQNYQNEWISKD